MSDLNGIIDPEQLAQYDWFRKGYKEARFSEARTRVIDAKGVEALLFIGTWCGDTHEHLPAFMKLIDTLKIKSAKIIALPRDKKGPLAEIHQISRLPTFVILEHQQELGRITESPQEDLLSDFEQILSLRRH